MFGYVKKDEPIVERIVNFFKLWSNEAETDKDGCRPFKEFQFYPFEVSYDFVFKWFVSEQEMKDVAKYIGIKLRKGQKKLTLTLGEYDIELEKYKDETQCSEGKKQIDEIIGSI